MRPLREPFAISNGCVSEKDAILVEMLAARGRPGRDFAYGRLFLQPPHARFELAHADREARAMDQCVWRVGSGGQWLPRSAGGDPFAVSGVDGALWDLAARQCERPLALLGGEVTGDRIRSAVGFAKHRELLSGSRTTCARTATAA